MGMALHFFFSWRLGPRRHQRFPWKWGPPFLPRLQAIGRSAPPRPGTAPFCGLFFHNRFMPRWNGKESEAVVRQLRAPGLDAASRKRLGIGLV